MISRPPEFSIGGKTFSRRVGEEFMAEMSHFKQIEDAQRRERQREFENLRIYAGVDNSQWPVELQRYMFNEDRGTPFERFTHIGQFNFCKMKLNGIAGSIARNPFDASYVADDAEQGHLTQALQQAWMSDRELMDWDSELLAAFIQGLIYQSLIGMYVKTDHPASPMGNIALEAYPPGSFFLDNEWRSNTSKTLENVWTLTYMNAEQIKARFEPQKGIIEQELWLLDKFGPQYEMKDLDWNKDLPYRHGDTFLVVEHNYLKKEKITRKFDPVTGITFWEWMDDDAQRELAMANNVDLSNIQEIKLWDNIEYVRAFAPGLSPMYLLQNEKSDIQIGRLKKFPWCPERANGKPLPMLDQLRDAQVEINKRQATITLAAETSVTSGIYADEAMFGSDRQKMTDFEQNRGNPRYVAWLKSGMSRMFPNGIGELVKQQVPGDLFGIVNEMIDLMDRLVPQPAASEGRTERSGESGILFAQKVEVAKTMQTTMIQSVRWLMNDIGEAYFFMAKQLYGQGRRTFTNGKGTKSITINETVINPYTGEEEIINDFSTLPRHRVVISESAAGVNNRLVQRELNATLQQQYQALPAVSLTFAAALIKSLDMDEIEKQAALEAVELEKRRIVSQTEAAISNANVAKQQADSMVKPQQALGGGGPMVAPPPEGAPVGGPAAPVPAALSGQPVELEADFGRQRNELMVTQ